MAGSSGGSGGGDGGVIGADELTEKLKRQLEFYLGEGNLLKDRFLRAELSKRQDGYLPLRLFLRFNRVGDLCRAAGVREPQAVLERLRAAAAASGLLALDAEGRRLRRSAPLRELEPVDDRTVYVDGLGAGVDHAAVAKMFSTVGQVLYVSLPRYRSTRDSKGFAFVEFETAGEARLAVERLGSVPSAEWRARLPKFSSQVKSLLRSAEAAGIDATQLEASLHSQGCGGAAAAGGEASAAAATASTSTSSDAASASAQQRLAVMPKADWLRLRDQLKAARDREIARLRRRIQKAKSAEASRSLDQSAGGGDSSDHRPAHLRYSPGLIVRLADPSGGLTRKRVRDLLLASGGEAARDSVAYVDAAEDGRTATIRCRDAAAAGRLLALTLASSAAPGLSVSALAGREELDYWDKIGRDWDEKHRPGCPLSGPPPPQAPSTTAGAQDPEAPCGTSRGGLKRPAAPSADGPGTSASASASASAPDAKRPKRIVFDSDED